MNDHILIVNQLDFPTLKDVPKGSDEDYINRRTLFLNSMPILSALISDDILLNTTAHRIAESLKATMAVVDVNAEQLARYLAEQRHELVDFISAKERQDYGHWVNDATEQDIYDYAITRFDPPTSSVLADFTIKDWNYEELRVDPEAPKSHLQSYRFKIEQSPAENSISFEIYPESYENLNNELVRPGLSGVIEIRNGKPGMSLGLHENELPVHLQSDGVNGLHIHHDPMVTPITDTFRSYGHKMEFKSTYFCCNDPGWFMKARTDIANIHFEAADMDGFNIVEDENWEMNGDLWRKKVFFDVPNKNEFNDQVAHPHWMKDLELAKYHEGDTLQGEYQLTFEPDSTVVINERSHISLNLSAIRELASHE